LGVGGAFGAEYDLNENARQIEITNEFKRENDKKKGNENVNPTH